jgi:hypothetical protein
MFTVTAIFKYMDQASHKYKNTFLHKISYLNILFFFAADEKIGAFKFGLMTVSSRPSLGTPLDSTWVFRTRNHNLLAMSLS